MNKREDLIRQTMLNLVELQRLDKDTRTFSSDDKDWQGRALKAEAQLDECRRQVELLVGEVACLRDALARRLTKA